MQEELMNIKKKLKQGKHTCLIMRMEHPRASRFVEFCNKTVTILLSRNYSTPIKRLQHHCQEITALLSRDYNTPVKRLQHSCQEIHKTPDKKMIKYLNFFLCTLVTLLFYLYVRTKRYITLLKKWKMRISIP